MACRGGLLAHGSDGSPAFPAHPCQWPFGRSLPLTVAGAAEVSSAQRLCLTSLSQHPFFLSWFRDKATECSASGPIYRNNAGMRANPIDACQRQGVDREPQCPLRRQFQRMGDRGSDHTGMDDRDQIQPGMLLSKPFDRGCDTTTLLGKTLASGRRIGRGILPEGGMGFSMVQGEIIMGMTCPVPEILLGQLGHDQWRRMIQHSRRDAGTGPAADQPERPLWQRASQSLDQGRRNGCGFGIWWVNHAGWRRHGGVAYPPPARNDRRAGHRTPQASRIAISIRTA